MASYTESDITTDEQAALDQIKEETEAAVKYDIAAKKAKDPVTKEAMEHNKKDEIEHAGLMGAVAVRENPENKDDMMKGVGELDEILKKSISQCIRERRETGHIETFQKAAFRPGEKPKGVLEGAENLLPDSIKQQLRYVTSSPEMWGVLPTGTTGAAENYYGTERGGKDDPTLTYRQNPGVAGWNALNYGMPDPTEYMTHRAMINQGRLNPNLYKLIMERSIIPTTAEKLEDPVELGKWIASNISPEPWMSTIRGSRGPAEYYSDPNYKGLKSYDIDYLKDMIDRNKVYERGSAGQILGQSNNILDDVDDVINNLYTLLDYSQKQGFPKQVQNAISKKISEYSLFQSRLAAAQEVDRAKHNFGFYPSDNTYDDEYWKEKIEEMKEEGMEGDDFEGDAGWFKDWDPEVEEHGLRDIISGIYGPKVAAQIMGATPEVDESGKEIMPATSSLRSLLSKDVPKEKREAFLNALQNMLMESYNDDETDAMGKPVMKWTPREGTLFEGTNLAEKGPESFVHLFDFIREHPQVLAEKPTPEKLIRDANWGMFGVSDTLNDDAIKAVQGALDKKSLEGMTPEEISGLFKAIGADPSKISNEKLAKKRLSDFLFRQGTGLKDMIDANEKAKPEWRVSTPFDIAHVLGADEFRTSGLGKAKNILEYIQDRKNKYGGSAGLLNALKDEEGKGIEDENGKALTPEDIDYMEKRLTDYIKNEGMMDRELGYNYDYSKIYEDPVYKFLDDVLNTSRRKREMSEKAMTAQSDRAADKYLEKDVTHDTEWNPEEEEGSFLDVGSPRLERHKQNQQKGLDIASSYLDNAWHDRELASGLLETLEDKGKNLGISSWDKDYISAQLNRILQGDSRGWDWLYGTNVFPALLRQYAVDSSGDESIPMPGILKLARKSRPTLLFEKENKGLVDSLKNAGYMPNGLGRSTQDIINGLDPADKSGNHELGLDAALNTHRILQPGKSYRGKGSSIEDIANILAQGGENGEPGVDISLLDPTAKNYKDSLQVIRQLNDMLSDWSTYKDAGDDELFDDEKERLEVAKREFPALFESLYNYKGKVGQVPDPTDEDPGRMRDIDASSIMWKPSSKDEIFGEFSDKMGEIFDKTRSEERSDDPRGGAYTGNITAYDSNPNLARAMSFINGSTNYSKLQNEVREMLAEKLGVSAADKVLRVINEFDEEKFKKLAPGEKRRPTTTNKLSYGMGEFAGIGKGIDQNGEEVIVPRLGARSADSLQQLHDDLKAGRMPKLSREEYQADMDKYIEDSENLKLGLKGFLGDAEFEKISPSIMDIDARDIPLFTKRLADLNGKKATAEEFLSGVPDTKGRYLIPGPEASEVPAGAPAPKATTESKKEPKKKKTKEPEAATSEVPGEKKDKKSKKKAPKTPKLDAGASGTDTTDDLVMPIDVIAMLNGSPTGGPNSFADSTSSLCTRIRIRSAADDCPVETGLTMKDIREPTMRDDANGSSVKQVGDSILKKSTSELMRERARRW